MAGIRWLAHVYRSWAFFLALFGNLMGLFDLFYTVEFVLMLKYICG